MPQTTVQPFDTQNALAQSNTFFARMVGYPEV